jgi:3-oxo-5-alpha-steroid 4-dehydrogenase 1
MTNNPEGLGEYHRFILYWILLAIAVFGYLWYKPAPYGRHASARWGPMMSNRWGWFIMELTVLISLFGWLQPWRALPSLPVAIMVGLFCLHYINRSLIFPIRMKTNGKKMPLAITLSAVVFNMVNGSLLGIWFLRFSSYTGEWLTDPRFITGLVLFIIGFVINGMADTRLFNLRRGDDTGYHLPRGWLFEYVSSPKLLGEIIEWTGYAVLTWSLPGLAFLVWTCANLAPRALANHRWYKARFPGYPPSRRVLLPFIW